MAMRAFYPMSEENMFEKLKETNDDVLIVGPSGVGKGHLAKRLHDESLSRSRKMFIHVNCASIPPALFESEVFGHVRGSFTGAAQDREGICAIVGDGDLFLDEIGDLPLDMQAKLLVLLNDRTFMPVGSGKTLKFLGRIIAATNKDLKAEAAAGRFREDFYYRLSDFIFSVKPLREQKDRIPELVESFIRNENSNIHLDRSALAYLSEQEWAGNIRQFKSVLKRIVTLCGGKTIFTAADIIPYMESECGAAPKTITIDARPDALMAALSEMIGGGHGALMELFVKNALKAAGGNVSAAARATGMSRKTIMRLMKELGLR